MEGIPSPDDEVKSKIDNLASVKEQELTTIELKHGNNK